MNKIRSSFIVLSIIFFLLYRSIKRRKRKNPFLTIISMTTERMCMVMKTVILSVLVLVFSNNAMAEWKEVGVDAAQQITTYADPSTIHKVGKFVGMWHLFDFKKTTEGYRSLKVQSEYDCEYKQRRTLFTSAHELNMGKGQVIDIKSGIGDWSPTQPGTPNQYLLSIACER